MTTDPNRDELERRLQEIEKNEAGDAVHAPLSARTLTVFLAIAATVVILPLALTVLL
ncbi:hypothetical protein [Salinibacterium sp. PAMC 21357]|uniref:hypothetical protein n=1 Tax=Salinibacterium sp. PAMC 21357 TaxID=1112215 RepID=UPI0002DF6D27|nr:hypothetical protein [Salinibacterium sp. PAMC 21357]